MVVLIGVMAAFGIFCLVWTVFYWLFSGGRGTVICLGESADSVLLARRLRLLRDLGLFRGTVQVLSVEEVLGKDAVLSGVEVVTPVELIRRIKIGAEEFGAAGDGDASGHRVGGGLSEL